MKGLRPGAKRPQQLSVHLHVLDGTPCLRGPGASAGSRVAQGCCRSEQEEKLPARSLAQAAQTSQLGSLPIQHGNS